jgi:hypothetical protein
MQRQLLRMLPLPALLLCVAPEKALLRQESGTGLVQPMPEGARAPLTRPRIAAASLSANAQRSSTGRWRLQTFSDMQKSCKKWWICGKSL